MPDTSGWTLRPKSSRQGKRYAGPCCPERSAERKQQEKLGCLVLLLLHSEAQHLLQQDADSGLILYFNIHINATAALTEGTLINLCRRIDIASMEKGRRSTARRPKTRTPDAVGPQASQADSESCAKMGLWSMRSDVSRCTWGG